MNAAASSGSDAGALSAARSGAAVVGSVMPAKWAQREPGADRLAEKVGMPGLVRLTSPALLVTALAPGFVEADLAARSARLGPPGSRGAAALGL